MNAVRGKNTGCCQRKLARHTAVIMRYHHTAAAGILALCGDIRGVARACAADSVNVHSAGTCAENAAQTRRAEGKLSPEAVLYRRGIVLYALKLGSYRRLKSVMLVPDIKNFFCGHFAPLLSKKQLKKVYALRLRMIRENQALS